MACHIEQQIFTNHTHQIDTRVAHVVFRVIFAPAGTHVAVDRVKALGNSTGTVDVGLFGNHDLLVLTPVTGFPGGTGATKARAGNKDVDVVFDDCFSSH